MADEKLPVTLGGELMFPSRYVTEFDLKGRDITVTILRIERGTLHMSDHTEKIKPIITFAETPKQFVLNVVNKDTIGGLYGTRAEDWIGKQITLYPAKHNGKIPCVRVRPEIPKPKPEPKKE